MNKNVVGVACALGAAALLGAAAGAQQGMQQHATMSAPSPITRAVAVLHPTQGNNVHGVVTFTRVVGRVRVVADIEGLTPGEHGFHIHEWGDCTAPDATSAGGHFNPTHAPHSGPATGERHVGDMGNITADASGKAHYDRFLSLIAFEGARSVLGRAVIVHAKADDLKTQPTGDAGGRVACGVIGVAKNP
jgi:Cu-Zn family superoxide dismutase